MGRLDELREYAGQYSTAPTLEDMPRKTLADKGIAGPTAAHFIEELHTPLNFSFLTVTTGTQAFQNIVGVTPAELPGRTRAGLTALKLAGVQKGDHILFCYPPLVNVFPAEALREYGVSWSFLLSSGRDALLLALCDEKPRVVVGESTFMRAALQAAASMDVADLLPRGTIFIAAGTPLDDTFPEVASEVMGGAVHDLYGCQEFGWLTLDGIPLREDISLLPTEREGWFDLVVGGLPTGDRFPAADSGHRCNPRGHILTYQRQRTGEELVTTVLATTAAGQDTIHRLARGILRIKARIVRVAPNVALAAPHTILAVAPYGQAGGTVIDTPEKTQLFDALVQAQMDYQAQAKGDPAWLKKR